MANISTSIINFESFKHQPMRRFIVISLMLIVPILISLFGLTSHASAATLTIVRPGDIRTIDQLATGPAGWYKTTAGTGTVELTTAQPYGLTGSAVLNASDPDSYVELALHKTVPNLELGSLNGLSYATKHTNSAGIRAITLQAEVDIDVSDDSTVWQGYLIYNPAYNADYYGSPLADLDWQTWSTTRPDAQWSLTWPTELRERYSISNPCPLNNPCDFARLTMLFPHIGLNATNGNPLSFIATGGVSGYLDGIALTYGAVDNIWDFEPGTATPVLPLSKDQCKNGGWENFGALFTNQGLCVSYVMTGL